MECVKCIRGQNKYNFMDSNENTKNSYKYKVNEECYHCQHMRRIPGDAHIGCTLHCIGNQFNKHGILNGWVIIFPELDFSCFDPVWKITRCEFFKEKI